MIQIPTQPKETAEASADGLRGVVEHVRTGRRWAFADPGELVAFLHADHRKPWKEDEP